MSTHVWGLGGNGARLIAGGYDACYRAVEASEDDAAAGVKDLEARAFTKQDVLVG